MTTTSNDTGTTSGGVGSTGGPAGITGGPGGATGGTAGGGSGGAPAEAGMLEAGAGDAGASTDAMSGADATGSGCVKGQTKGSEVVVIGDSFIAINHAITNQIQSKARAAGALGPSDRYRDLSVSGTTLGNDQIPGQYASAVRSGPVKVVLMNGGGNDCLLAGDSAGALRAATALLESMGQNNTEHVVYFFYPDPAGFFAGGSLQSCLDTLRPQIKSLCEQLTRPKCHLIDLRSLWQPSYVMADGIHPTQQGGAAVGDVVWDTMQERCIVALFDLDALRTLGACYAQAFRTLAACLEEMACPENAEACLDAFSPFSDCVGALPQSVHDTIYQHCGNAEGLTRF